MLLILRILSQLNYVAPLSLHTVIRVHISKAGHFFCKLEKKLEYDVPPEGFYLLNTSCLY